MKLVKRILLVLFLILTGVIMVNYPKLTMISGYAAKSMASQRFIAQRSVESITNNDHNVPLVKLAEASTKGASAKATVYGLKERTAVCREGLGCILVNDDFDINSLGFKPNRSVPIDTLPFPYGNRVTDTIFENVDYDLLTKAMDSAFAHPEVQKTRTVLVAYKNRIIAEKYLEGFTKDTPVLGWSITKSLLATLYGILEHSGELNLEDRAPIEEWQNDERKNITLNHLLRMQSGLEWEEDYSKLSDVTKMLFVENNMTQSTIPKEAIAKPKEIWNYSSGTTNLLSGILRDRLGSHQEYLDFPYVSLIDRIGMQSMLLEVDMAGNYVMSAYGWANTRDWAKFGLLYLNGGNWNGDQLFDQDWIDYATRPTKNSNGRYGAHFWLNANGRYPDVPKDLYSANGYQGQYVFIIPSKDLVIVRTGLAGGRRFDVNKFLSSIINAIH